MKSRNPILIALAVFLLAPVGTALCQATTVRGQLLRNGQQPASGIQVTLYNNALGRSSPATTGEDGMYYLYNVPFGNYHLEVWISNPPTAYPMRIFTPPGAQFCDLPRLPVP